jgi:hypothetical protein
VSECSYVLLPEERAVALLPHFPLLLLVAVEQVVDLALDSVELGCELLRLALF